MAKTYLEAYPSSHILILDSAPSVGGVWASNRLSPGLKSNNMLGTYEFSDFPMDPKLFGVKPGEHIPGTVMNEYLTRYAQRFGLMERIRFRAEVESAEHREGGGWVLRFVVGGKGPGGSEFAEVGTKRLVVATGMTSEAFLPAFEGSEGFDAPLFHCRDFLDHERTLETAESVVVFGGTKSAWDAVYAYAAKGVKVDWVIRGMLSSYLWLAQRLKFLIESGHGPCWMAVSRWHSLNSCHR
jgi:cation diffusion facilitator CzcD-associated flavoprotein CzcO